MAATYGKKKVLAHINGYNRHTGHYYNTQLQTFKSMAMALGDQPYVTVYFPDGKEGGEENMQGLMQMMRDANNVAKEIDPQYERKIRSRGAVGEMVVRKDSTVEMC